MLNENTHVPKPETEDQAFSAVSEKTIQAYAVAAEDLVGNTREEFIVRATESGNSDVLLAVISQLLEEEYANNKDYLTTLLNTLIVNNETTVEQCMLAKKLLSQNKNRSFSSEFQSGFKKALDTKIQEIKNS